MKSYNWAKSEMPQNNGLKAFGTFVGGGGSTMGYKLAGFDHLGGVEIDKRMASIYGLNNAPKYVYVEDIRQFNEREDLPKELYNLDLFEGSPPCTTFSMAGKREKGWGVKKRFNEGQATQTLDDLVYVWCDTVDKLKPKVAVMENVPGLIGGAAKGYAIGIYDRLMSSGYDVQMFLLNSATMGVPQSRERVFYVARRQDLNLPEIAFNFDLKPIEFGGIVERGAQGTRKMWPSIEARWPFIEYGDQNLKFADAKYRNLATCNAFFSTCVMYDHVVPGALTSSGTTVYWNEKRTLSDLEYVRMSSFPTDYDFNGMDVRYVCGMSIPPLMTYSIGKEIARQWFDK